MSQTNLRRPSSEPCCLLPCNYRQVFYALAITVRVPKFSTNYRRPLLLLCGPLTVNSDSLGPGREGHVGLLYGVDT